GMRATKNRSEPTATTRAVAGCGRACASVEPGLVTLLAHAEPVPLPLRDVAEGAHVADPVDVDDPVEVIGLVLDHPREKFLGHQGHGVAVAIHALEPHPRTPPHHPPHIAH